jgi:hypothetical protein
MRQRIDTGKEVASHRGERRMPLTVLRSAMTGAAMDGDENRMQTGTIGRPETETEKAWRLEPNYEAD